MNAPEGATHAETPMVAGTVVVMVGVVQGVAAEDGQGGETSAM